MELFTFLNRRFHEKMNLEIFYQKVLRRENSNYGYITAAAWCHDTFASHTFANEVKYYNSEALNFT